MKFPTMWAVTLVALLAGCGGAQHSQTTAATARAEEPGPSTDTRPMTPVVARNDTDADCNVAPVYFEFDSADLTPQMRDVLQRNARCLETHPDRSVSLVGSTDPRGTEEYNLALGDRRARSVMGYLTSLGVPNARVHETSVGEEEARGTDEHSWALDRVVKDH
jgi:peptidoglycan-associated lipoprotein